MAIQLGGGRPAAALVPLDDEQMLLLGEPGVELPTAIGKVETRVPELTELGWVHRVQARLQPALGLETVPSWLHGRTVPSAGAEAATGACCLRDRYGGGSRRQPALNL